MSRQAEPGDTCEDCGADIGSSGCCWNDHTPDDGERDACTDCGESFNLNEGGQDYNEGAGGPLCGRCEDGWTRWVR